MPRFKRNTRTRRTRVIKNVEIPKSAFIIVISIALVFLVALVYKMCESHIQIAKEKEQSEIQTNQVNQIFEEDYSKIEGEKYEKQDEVINIIALGNIICESDLSTGLYDEYDDNYKFIRFLDRIQQYVGIADYTVAHLETNFANVIDSNNKKLNAPSDLAIALKEAGVDILTTCGEHSNDYGKEGIKETLDFLDDLQIEHIGTNRTVEESENIKVVDVRGIKVAFLAYTDKANVKEKYLVNTIDENRITKDIQTAKEKGAEYILVSLHWGEEKSDKISQKQENLANKIIDVGADFIIGTHPNKIGDIKIKQNQAGKDVGIAYSLGNFISKGEEKLEISLDLELTKSVEDGQVRMTKLTYTPMYFIEKQDNANEKYMLVDVKQEIERYEAGVQNNLTDENYNKILAELENLRNKLK